MPRSCACVWPQFGQRQMPVAPPAAGHPCVPDRLRLGPDPDSDPYLHANLCRRYSYRSFFNSFRGCAGVNDYCYCPATIRTAVRTKRQQPPKQSYNQRFSKRMIAWCCVFRTILPLILNNSFFSSQLSSMSKSMPRVEAKHCRCQIFRVIARLSFGETETHDAR